MQASLGRKGDYSVRAVLDIARHDGERRKAREIAAEMDIPHRFLTQILAELVQVGLLEAVAGRTGGYVLARPPSEISLLQVVEAAEGPIALDVCVLRGGPCTWENSCPVHIPWARAQNAMAEHLAGTSFADLIAIAGEIDTGTHRIPDDTPPHKTPTPRLPKPRARRKR
ncbi:MAG: RrF2 family transcriptional regulator [Acidimicrobiia bacterium]